MIELKGLFKLAPALAIKYFKNKGNTHTWDWYELWQDAHQKSFTVTKVMREDVLKDIRSALDKALSEGKTFHDFQKELKPILQKKGWWGEQIVVDSEGVAEKVQLGSMYRLKTIYSVNMQVAYQTGRYTTQMDNSDNRPYWEYVAIMDASTRPEHAELNGLVYRYDDPFWKAFYPPNGWRCRCRVNTLSNHALQKHNIPVSNSNGCLSKEQHLVSKKSGEYKPVTVYTDPLTGKKIAPDVGWSHNPASGLVTKK